MGEVYRATDTRLKRFIAIKFLSADFSLDEKRLQYFEREARLASALNHPNIVTIYDIGRSEFGPYIAMELVEGKTLRDSLADGPLPVRRVLQLAAQIADGLAKAHAAGIFHRDLKPENLMIARDGLLKILDFGLAKLVPAPDHAPDATADTPDSKPGFILGTIGYMSPEQASGLPADFRSDQFSLGTILYEMLTGKRAFKRATPVETLSSIIRDEPEPIAVANPKVPMNVRWILERCLAKNVEERYASTLDLARDLQNLRDHFSGVEGWDASRPLAKPVLGTTRWVRVLAAGLTALVLVIAVAAILSRDSPTVPLFRQISFGHGSITGARFAGDRVIYGANFEGPTPELYSTQPGHPESSLERRNAGIWSVSPSGKKAIANPCTLNWGNCMGPLVLVPPAGGVRQESLPNVTGADWAPDDKTLAVAQFENNNARIVRHPDGEVLFEGPGWITDVRISPKGDHVAFLEHPLSGDIGGSVSVVDFRRKSERKVLSSGWKGLIGLVWAPGGEEIWFTGSRDTKGNGFRLFAASLAGRGEQPVYSAPSSVQILDVSRDGSQVLLRRLTPRSALMGLTSGDSKERPFSLHDFSTAADLSSDGKTLLFYEWGTGVGGQETIYTRKTDGGDATKIGEGKPLVLSPDGQFVLALRSSVSEPPQLVLLRTTPVGEPIPLPRGEIDEFKHWAAWSPDGERVFFTAAARNSRPRTWIQNISGGLPEPVTTEGIQGILLDPDGKRIAVIDRYDHYYICPINCDERRPLEGYEEDDKLLQWSRDAIFLRGGADAELKIFRLDLRTGLRKLFKDLTPRDAAGIIDIGSDPGQVRITPDGQSYVYTLWTAVGELYVVEGLNRN